MVRAELKVCPRCAGEFVCRADAIASCQCRAVRLSIAQSAALVERYGDCLCAECLAAYAASALAVTER